MNIIYNQVLDYSGKEIEITAFHPGEFLLEEIEERKLALNDVVTALDMVPHHLSEIFAGKRDISKKMALKIEQLLKISANYWMGMQIEYNLYVDRFTKQ